MNAEAMDTTGNCSQFLDWRRPAEVFFLAVDSTATELDDRAGIASLGTTSGTHLLRSAGDRVGVDPGAGRPADDLARIESLLKEARSTSDADLSALRSTLSWPIEGMALLESLATPSRDTREYVAALPNAASVALAARVLRLAGLRDSYPTRAVAMGDGGAGLIWRRGPRFVEITAENGGALFASRGEVGKTSTESELGLDLDDLEGFLAFLTPVKT